MNEPNAGRIVFLISHEDAEQLHGALESAGARPARAPAPEPGAGTELASVPILIAISAAMGIAQLANFILQMWRGGTIIDAREDPIQITRSRSIPNSDVHVLAPDGVTHTHTASSASDLNEFLSRVLGSAMSSGDAGG